MHSQSTTSVEIATPAEVDRAKDLLVAPTRMQRAKNLTAQGPPAHHPGRPALGASVNTHCRESPRDNATKERLGTIMSFSEAKPKRHRQSNITGCTLCSHQRPRRSFPTASGSALTHLETGHPDLGYICLCGYPLTGARGVAKIAPLESAMKITRPLKIHIREKSELFKGLGPMNISQLPNGKPIRLEQGIR